MSPHIRLGFLLALGLILASAGVAYRNTRHFMDVSASVAHTHEVRAELAAVLSTLERAETGQRGYIITGDRRYLRPHPAARAAIPHRPRDFLPHVFERFRQDENAATGRHGGLGIGLAIVRNLVELHGGTIEAQSAGEGQGATFTVRLPTAARPPVGLVPAPRPAVGRETLDATQSLKGVRALVVDDDAEARRSIAAVLEQSGATVRAVSSVAEAVAALGEEPPHVLLTDIVMPGADGYTLIRQVRALASERGGGIPAIAVTAYPEVNDRHRAVSAGFQRHLSKPLDPAELISVVAHLAGEPRHGPEVAS